MTRDADPTAPTPARPRGLTTAGLVFLIACGATAPPAATPPIEPVERDTPEAQPASPWRPFAATSPWNRPIGDAALHPDSEVLVAHLRASKEGEGVYLNIAEYSVPVYFVSGAPMAAIRIDLSNHGLDGLFDAPWDPSMQVAGGTDQHLAIVDRSAGRTWDFWAMNADHARVAADMDLSGEGVRPMGPREGEPREEAWWESHGSRACGYPLIAGLVYPDEFRAGRIEHALALGYPGIRPDVYVPPASTAQANFEQLDPAQGIPCGARVQLDPALDIDALALGPHAATLLRALQEYGAYIADFSGGITLYGEGSADGQREFGELGVRSDLLHEHPELLAHLRVLDWGTPYPGALNRRPD